MVSGLYASVPAEACTHKAKQARNKYSTQLNRKPAPLNKDSVYVRAIHAAAMATDVVADAGSRDIHITTKPVSNESIEERCFAAALICLEGHYNDSPLMGPQTNAKVVSMISKTLEKTHASKDVR